MVEKKDVFSEILINGIERKVEGACGIDHEVGSSKNGIYIDSDGVAITPPLEDDDDAGYNAAAEALCAQYIKDNPEIAKAYSVEAIHV